jgi:hypothetical protein
MQQNVLGNSKLVPPMPQSVNPNMIQSDGLTTDATQKQGVQQLLQILKNNPGPDQQQQRLQRQQTVSMTNRFSEPFTNKVFSQG